MKILREHPELARLARFLNAEWYDSTIRDEILAIAAETGTLAGHEGRIEPEDIDRAYDALQEGYDEHDGSEWPDDVYEPSPDDESWLREQHAQAEEDERWRDYEEWCARFELDQAEPISDEDHAIATGCV